MLQCCLCCVIKANPRNHFKIFTICQPLLFVILNIMHPPCCQTAWLLIIWLYDMINYTTIDYAPSNYCISFKYFIDPTDAVMSWCHNLLKRWRVNMWFLKLSIKNSKAVHTDLIILSLETNTSTAIWEKQPQ